MCRECQERVPQAVYCVHADRIAHLDTEIARGAGREHGRFEPIVTSARALIDERRDEIAGESMLP